MRIIAICGAHPKRHVLAETLAEMDYDDKNITIINEPDEIMIPFNRMRDIDPAQPLLIKKNSPIESTPKPYKSRYARRHHLK